MSRENVATYMHDPSADTQIAMEVDRDGIHQVIQRRTVIAGQTVWVRDLGEPPPIRTAEELVDKMHQGQRHYGYLCALLKAWSCVVQRRGGQEVRA